MLRAFEENLKRLSKDPSDPFHTAIRQRIGKRATAILEERLRSLIMMMPTLITRMRFYWDRSKTESRVKRLGSCLMTYLYHPEDFLSEEEFGFFGYLDDAYFVALIYEQAMSDLLAKGECITQLDSDLVKQIKFTKRYAKAVIPKEAKKIETMIEEILLGNYAGFSGVFNNKVKKS